MTSIVLSGHTVAGIELRDRMENKRRQEAEAMAADITTRELLCVLVQGMAPLRGVILDEQIEERARNICMAILGSFELTYVGE